MVYILNGHRVIDENRNLRIDIIRAPTTAGRDRDGVPYQGIQGSSYGFTAGGYFNGYNVPQPASAQDVIDRFPFTTFSTATDVGDLAAAIYDTAGQSSSTHGYVSGGFQETPTIAYTNNIQKYPFAQSSGTATNVGTMTQTKYRAVGTSSETHGYNAAGLLPWPSSPPTTNVIEKFPFASDGSSSDVGDVTYIGWGKAPASSSSHGYSAGYFSGGNIIEKHSFAADGNATDVGDLAYGRSRIAGQSSVTDGYASGHQGPTSQQYIQKFSFGSDGNATSVGTLAPGAPYNRNTTGQSATAAGYVSGGEYGPPPGTYSSLFTDYNVIHRFPFAITSGSASDVGDLSQARNRMSGHQV